MRPKPLVLINLDQIGILRLDGGIAILARHNAMIEMQFVEQPIHIGSQNVRLVDLTQNAGLARRFV